MPLSALVLALGSAVLHAIWNLLLGAGARLQAATAATFVLALAIALPFARRLVEADPSVWPYALASTLLEIAYVRRARATPTAISDISFVYPVYPRARAGARAARVRVARARRTARSPPRERGVLLVAARRRARRRGGAAAATRARSSLVATIARHDRRVHARRPRGHPARGRADVLRARARRAVPRLPAARRRARDPAASWTGRPCSRRSRTSARSRSALLALRYGSRGAGARGALVVGRDRDAARRRGCSRSSVSRRRIAGSVLVFAGVALLAVSGDANPRAARRASCALRARAAGSSRACSSRARSAPAPSPSPARAARSRRRRRATLESVRAPHARRASRRPSRPGPGRRSPAPPQSSTAASRPSRTSTLRASRSQWHPDARGPSHCGARAARSHSSNAPGASIRVSASARTARAARAAGRVRPLGSGALPESTACTP